jgi:hypothetical protein
MQSVVASTFVLTGSPNALTRHERDAIIRLPCRLMAVSRVPGRPGKNCDQTSGRKSQDADQSGFCVDRLIASFASEGDFIDSNVFAGPADDPILPFACSDLAAGGSTLAGSREPPQQRQGRREMTASSHAGLNTSFWMSTNCHGDGNVRRSCR